MTDPDATRVHPQLAKSEPADPLGDKPRRIGRFELERLLGAGGMGQVYEAWDPRLERWVAVKTLKDSDPLAARRFVREARLQAAVSHPGVCPVFEVGEEAGAPYLVMPRLGGLPLDEAVAGESLERKLALVRQAAEAVHEAHRSGLIHRDLKPANILVEAPEEGPPRPVVLDFGIARPLAGDGLTQTGEAIGTPAFMAPEQIEATSKDLDRRIDVYALGATLYRLLAQRPPFEGRGPTLLLQILRDEPTGLKAQGIPADVEAIVFKCLEKDRRRRYATARELADDLGRYLDGETVRARRVGRRVRLAKWLHRNRLVVRVASVALVLLALALGWGAWTAWRSEARTQLAQDLTAQVEEIEARVRYSNLAPLHDVRPDRIELRRRMEGIRTTMERAGDAGRAPGNYALGRGHLAVGEPELARRHLTLAWEAGYRGPEVAAALGLALSELYRDRVTSLERVRDRAGEASLRGQLRDQLGRIFGAPLEVQKQLQRSLGEPAREMLSQGRVDGAPEGVLLDALVLFHDGRFEEALQILEQPVGLPSWSSEPMRLEGDVRRSWAVTLHGGGDPEGARRQLELSRRAYARASTVAESDAAIFRDDAQAVYLLLALELVPVELQDQILEEGLASVDRALVADPDAPRSLLWRARLQRLAARLAETAGEDPEPWLELGIETLERVLEVDPEGSVAWTELARAHGSRARWKVDRGADPTTDLERARIAFDEVAEPDRDYAYYTSLGRVDLARAAWRVRSGGDATTSFRSAVDAFEAAAEQHSAPFVALINLGVALRGVAEFPDSESRDLLPRAIGTFEKARSLDPDHMVPHYYLGLTRLRLAQGGRAGSGLWNPVFAEAAAQDLERAIELGPDRFQPWVGVGELHHFEALAANDRGEDPGPLFAAARRFHEQAIALAPEHPIPRLNLGWTSYFEGKIRQRSGGQGEALLVEAEGHCRQSLEALRRPNALLCLASTLRLRAEAASVAEGRPSPENLHREAVRTFEEILELEPEHAEAHRSLGRLHTTRAVWLLDRGLDPRESLQEGRRSLDRALELETEIALFWLADARWYRVQSRWQVENGAPATDAISAGRSSLEKARRLRPEWRALDEAEASFAELLSRVRG